MRDIRAVADHLERTVRLDARAHVKVAVMIKRPAAMLALDAAQIVGNLPLERRVSRSAAIVPKQDVFGGNCRVGFEFEHPMPVALLAVEQRLSCPVGHIAEAGRGMRFLYQRHAAALSRWPVRLAAR